MLGAFLTVASGLGDVVTRWTEKVQVIVYLEDGIEDRVRDEPREPAARGPRGRRRSDFVSREQALARFREMFRDLQLAARGPRREPVPRLARGDPDGRAPVAGRGPAAGEGLRRACPGVREIQYDLLWIERLATGVRLVRGVGAFLGGILVLAGVFTISNVIRLTIYAREDELDIMRLVGATRAYVKGPFVAEGMIQGGLGGLVAAGPAVGGPRVALAGPRLLGPARPRGLLAARRPSPCCSWSAAWSSASSAA